MATERKIVLGKGSPIAQVNWVGKSTELDVLLMQGDSVTVHAMNQGLEAEVMELRSGIGNFVLKVWNKSSKPDIGFQFQLLRVLSELGLSVSMPVGWGINQDSDKVLLTSFDGNTFLQLSEAKMTAMANLLSRIHQIPAGEIREIELPKYSFTGYFFPGVREHDDLHQALLDVMKLIVIKQERMIHGDFHLGNIVEMDDRITVIDWTNGQWGDSRYDFAWSLTLQRIYISDRYAGVFRSAYLTQHNIPPEELEAFEALACLRWMLLNRRGGSPRGPHTMERVQALISTNRCLTGREFRDFPLNKKAWDGEGMNLEAIFAEFPVLESEALILKKIEDQHLDELFEIYDNDTVFEYCGIIPKHNKGTVKNMIGHFERDYKKRFKVKWGIFAQQADDQLLGIIEIFDMNPKVNAVTIGYYSAEAHWGKGITTAAVKMLVDFLFEEVRVNRIQAEVMPVNEASKKVLLKNGFVKEGLLRQASLWAGKGVIDLELYSILKEDFNNEELS